RNQEAPVSVEVIEWEQGCENLGRSVAAIGVFDGVHLGHAALIADTVALAQKRGARSVVVTFDRDPDQVVTPEAAAPQLLSLPEKIELVGELGADVVLVFPFCMRMAEMAPKRFLDDVFMSALEPVVVLVGRDFRFGNRASGTVETLSEYGASAGFEVIPHELVVIGGEPVTSTRIRRLVSHGQVESADVLLGRLHRLHGRVGHGRGEGASVLGVPTANIRPEQHAAVPADGVYAGWASVAGRRYPAAISVGVPPSFPEAHDYLEAHLLGFEGDLYNTDIMLEFARRLRAQEAFDSTDALAARIRADIEHVALMADPADGKGLR
ncbi:MAG: riboflavin biosynthesis protein RibF, partial [Coriobacteriia bacterium]|nr:riboflavin biosynthesis protein RibF [Coriobacteriia bacterium]